MFFVDDVQQGLSLKARHNLEVRKPAPTCLGHYTELRMNIRQLKTSLARQACAAGIYASAGSYTRPSPHE